MEDTTFFEKVSGRLEIKASSLDNKAFVDIINQVINTDFLTFSQIEQLCLVITDFAGGISPEIRQEAKIVFSLKNRERGGLWRQVGLIGSLVEIHGKLARLELNFTDKDSQIDLFNYLIIALMSIELGLIKILGKEKPKVVITGDSQGLGQKIVEMFAINGYEVAPYGIRRSLPEIQKFFEEYPYPKIDYLVNNYGTNKLNWIGSIEEQDYHIIDDNVKLPSMVVNELVAKNLGPTNILNILSQTYRIPQRCTSLYCASKAAMAQMTKVMARELADERYVVNGLAPGKILGTRMTQLTDRQVLELRGWETKAADKYALSLIPMHRFTTMEEVALAAIKIMHMPPYVNGAIIDMAGAA